MSNAYAAKFIRDHRRVHGFKEPNAVFISEALRRAENLLELPELHWVETAEREPEEYVEGDQVFTLPVTLGGKADLTYTHHVGDDPSRYPYWMSIYTVLELLSKIPPVKGLNGQEEII